MVGLLVRLRSTPMLAQPHDLREQPRRGPMRSVLTRPHARPADEVVGGGDRQVARPNLGGRFPLHGLVHLMQFCGGTDSVLQHRRAGAVGRGMSPGPSGRSRSIRNAFKALIRDYAQARPDNRSRTTAAAALAT